MIVLSHQAREYSRNPSLKKAFYWFRVGYNACNHRDACWQEESKLKSAFSLREVLPDEEEDKRYVGRCEPIGRSLLMDTQSLPEIVYLKP